MTRDEFVLKLTEAGNKYDGHVTNGSIVEQLKVIDEFYKKPGYFDVEKFLKESGAEE